jgi:hypothetical protein
MSIIGPTPRSLSQQNRRSATIGSMRPSRLTTAVRVDDVLWLSRSAMNTMVVQRISRVAIDSSKSPPHEARKARAIFFPSVRKCSSPAEKRQQSQNRAAGVLSERPRRFGLTPLVGMCRWHYSNPLAIGGAIRPMAGENRLDMARLRVSRAPVSHGRGPRVGSMLFPRSATRLRLR